MLREGVSLLGIVDNFSLATQQFDHTFEALQHAILLTITFNS